MSATGMINMARKSLGWGEPNEIHRWYGARNGSYFKKGSTPWCQMSITYWAYKSGNYKAVCPNGDRAYTVYAARRDAGKNWKSGTSENIKRYAKPGAIVWFDWSGSNNAGAVDHVGLVTKNLGDGRVATIEGNTSNRCAVRVRSGSSIAGFWNPPYSGSAPPAPAPANDVTNDDVKKLAHAFLNAGYNARNDKVGEALQSVKDNTEELLRRISSINDKLG